MNAESAGQLAGIGAGGGAGTVCVQWVAEQAGVVLAPELASLGGAVLAVVIAAVAQWVRGWWAARKAGQANSAEE